MLVYEEVSGGQLAQTHILTTVLTACLSSSPTPPNYGDCPVIVLSVVLCPPLPPGLADLGYELLGTLVEARGVAGGCVGGC